MCRPTVFGEMPSAAATCLLAWPRAISRSTSTSRSVSPAGRLICGGRVACPAAASTASTSSRVNRPASTSATSCVRRVLCGQRRTVRTVLGHRVVRIGGRQQPSAEVEPIRLGAAVVPGAVGSFVVAGGDVGVRGEEAAAAEHSFAEVRMEADPFPLLGAERAGVIPDAARHADTPDVVHQRRPTDGRRIRRGQASCARGGDRRGWRHRSSARAATRDFKSVKSATAASAPSSSPGPIRSTGAGSAVEHLRARIVADRGQPTLAVRDEGVDDRRVIGVAPPVTEHVDRGRPAGLASPQLDVAGDRDDTDRHRHLVAGQAVRHALAVPALVGVGEGPRGWARPIAGGPPSGPPPRNDPTGCAAPTRDR